MKQNDKRRKKSQVGRVIIGIFAVAAVSGSAFAVYNVKAAKNSGETVSEYREYTVSQGSITIGTSESGTVTVEREYISYPASAEVEEIFVKVGASVNEGDPVLRLSADDIDEVREELEEKIEAAKEALEEAKLDLTTRSAEALLTYNSSVSKGSTAQAEYDSYLEKSAASRVSEEKNLSSLKQDREEYISLSGTYAEDDAKLTAAEEKVDSLKDTYKEMEKQYKQLQNTDTANAEAVEDAKEAYEDYKKSMEDKVADLTERQKTYEDTKTAYEQAQKDYDEAVEDYQTALQSAAESSLTSSSGSTSSSSDSTSSSQSQSGSSSSGNSSGSVSTAEKKMNTAKKALTAAGQEYNLAKMYYTAYEVSQQEKYESRCEEYEDQIAQLEDEQQEHEKVTKAYKSEMEDHSELITDAEEEYTTIKEIFTEKYGSDDADTLAEKIEKLDDDIASAELSIKTSAVDSISDDMDAQLKAEQALSDASNAKAVYDQTISSLQSSIDDKQKAYDELVEEYEEFCESVETGGIVYAPVSGAVSQVNVSEGDKVQADSYLVTLMDKRYIYLTAAVSEEDITSLYVGQECSVSLTAYEGKSFAAHIDTISTEPARSSGSVSYTVTVKLDDESGLNVLEGMSGEIDFIEKQADNVLTVNVNAITFRDGVSYVKVYDETGNVTEKPVVTGFTDGRNVEIVSGAEEGDKVLVKIELSSSEKKK